MLWQCTHSSLWLEPNGLLHMVGEQETHSQDNRQTDATSHTRCLVMLTLTAYTNAIYIQSLCLLSALVQVMMQFLSAARQSRC